MSDPAANFTPEFQYALSEICRPLAASVAGGGQVRFQCGGHHDGGLSNLRKKAAPESRGDVKENALVAHGLQLRVGDSVAVLDAVCASIDGGLNTARVDSMGRDLQALTVSLLNNCGHFRRRDVIVDRNLDDIDVIEDVLSHRLPCPVRAIDR